MAQQQQGYNAFGDSLLSTPAASSFEMDAATFDEIQQLPGNSRCVDCGTKSPDWGSPNLGILFCFQCSGKHRGLGVHLSFVRSVRMDAWTDRQIRLMRQGSNDRCNAFLRDHGVEVDNSNNKEDVRSRIRQKYDTEAAQLYQQVLKAEIDGKPVPTKLESRQNKPSTAGAPMRRKMEGFGSSPPPEPEGMSTTTTTLLCVAVPALAAAALYMLVPH